MRRRVIAGAAGAALILAAARGLSAIGRRRVHANVFVATPPGEATPADRGMPFSDLQIRVARRAIHAWLVPAPQARAAAIVFHGQHDALAQLVPAIERLHRAGVTVLAFNYSGHGRSGGTPTIEAVRADSAAAYAQFRDAAGGLPRFAIGYSLGAAVLLDALSHHRFELDGLVLASPFASVRAVAVADGLPRWLAPAVPDVYNNVRAVRRARCPVRIVHSASDGTFPLWMPQAIQAASPAAELCVVPSPRHAEVLAPPAADGDWAAAYWQAVLVFITAPR